MCNLGCMREVFMAEAQKVPTRAEVPVEHTWNLAAIFADAEAWNQDVARLEGMLPELAALQGKLGTGSAALLRALALRDDITKILHQLYVYASHLKDSDSTNPAGQALDERAGSLMARIGAALAFVEPEILAIPQETIAAWQKSEPKLQIYGYELEELARQ